MQYKIWLFVGIFASLGAMNAVAYDNELGYTDPVVGVPWYPPVAQEQNDAMVAPAPLTAHERCLQRAGTSLLGEKLMCATRASMDAALREAGALPLPNGEQKDVLVYDSRQLWAGSGYVSVGFTGHRFSVIDIAYPPVASWYEQLYLQLVKEYGKPKRIEGSPFSAKGVMWQRDDSIQIWLHQPQPKVLLLSYVRPDMYQYWTKPRVNAR